MAEEDHPVADKEALKRLRQARKPVIEAASARLKEQQKAVRAIKAELQGGERTVPELAAATGISADLVLWYVMALKKYGEIAEGQVDGGYFRYGLAADSSAGQE